MDVLKKIQNYVSSVEYVSFDIFDTLIFRNLSEPKDLFYYVEKEYNKKYNENISFYNQRIEAEKIARENKQKEEITLDDIYNILKLSYSSETCLKLKEIEINLEIEFCQSNFELLNIFNSIKKDKKIIITSDMYLPKNIIVNILEKCGYVGYHKLYLSSEVNKTKKNGTLFDYIKKDLKIPGKKIMHIGDNRKSDFVNARIKGINSIHYKRSLKKMYINEKNKSIDYKALNYFIYNNLQNDKNNYFYCFGYSCFGPLLYSFCNWLNVQFEEDGIEKIYFLARDGKIIKRAFEMIFPKVYNINYMYASRRMLIVPSLAKCNSKESIFSTMFLPKRITIKSLLNKLGMENEDLSIFETEFNLKTYKEYETEKLIRSIDNWITNNIDLIKKNSKEESNCLNKYLDSIEFNSKLAIVDIGWFGNMQKSLSQIRNKSDIYGYYVGLNPCNENQSKYNMKGYLFENGRNQDLYDKEHYFNSIFEFIFSTNHGSVMRIDKNNNPIMYDYEYKNSKEEKILEYIQNGALQFINDFIKTNTNRFISLDVVDCIDNLLTFALYPSYEDASKFGNIKFLDGDINYIASPKKLNYYIFHIKELKKDFLNSSWRIGFFKRLFKINVDYYKVNNLIRKKLKK